MPKDKTLSHRKVLAAAKEEFMKYGFENASMRRIGERAGMTAAGLYRHCGSKEELFAELVSPAVERVEQWLAGRCCAAGKAGTVCFWQESETDMMRDVIYPHMEEYRLLLTKAQGTRYEGFLHDLTELHQEKMTESFPVLTDMGYPVREISPKELHLLMSAYTAALFEPVIQGYTAEEAEKSLECVEDFFLPGWKKLLGF